MPIFFSPAKVNFFFRVLNKREDGYHNIASLFLALNFGDTITYELSERDCLICNDPAVPLDQSNLIFKALSLFRQRTGWEAPLSIDLNKQIPMQAGLGGGSGNAATTLYAASQLSGLNIPEGELQAWAAQIGSDVPFFFSEGVAFCRSRGEDVLPISKDITWKKGWIIKPDYGLSTPLVYQRLNLHQVSEECPQKLLMDLFLQDRLSLINDLEKSAFAIEPKLKRLKERLQSLYPHVLMTGSGTAFLCLGDALPPYDLQSFKVQPLRRLKHMWYPLQPCGHAIDNFKMNL